jgi:hypothetical protein
LEPGGVVCYWGIPDFANIAWFYLERRPGIVGPVFDLFNVYRYTHGDPPKRGQVHGPTAQEPVRLWRSGSWHTSRQHEGITLGIGLFFRTKTILEEEVLP